MTMTNDSNGKAQATEENMPDHLARQMENGMKAAAELRAAHERTSQLLDASEKERRFLDEELKSKAISLTRATDRQNKAEEDREKAIQYAITIETRFRDCTEQVVALATRMTAVLKTFPPLPERPAVDADMLADIEKNIKALADEQKSKTNA